MKLSENYRKRLKSLSGIRLNEIELKASSGRSGKNTFGYFVEEYLLNLGSVFLDNLKNSISQLQDKKLEIKKTENRIDLNSLILNFEIEDQSNINQIEEFKFQLNFLVKLESNSNTVAILKYENVNDEFNLQSKHSDADVNDFIKEIITRIVNVEKTT